MDCVILVPRRPDPWRDQLWRFVRREIEEELGWPIFEGLSVDGPFNRSRALNEAAAAAGERWDVAVILDADTVPDVARVREAAFLAVERGRLVCPQDVFRSLSRSGTRSVLRGECQVQDAPKRWDYPRPKSSCLLVEASLWEAVGGFDERFEGWGFEDASFYHACEALRRTPDRLEGPVWHLWHPRSEEKNPDRVAYQFNQALGARYKEARRDRAAMQAILAEPGGPLA